MSRNLPEYRETRARLDIPMGDIPATASFEFVFARLWAKLERDEAERVISWHSLIDHSADVAAVFASMLAVPMIENRLQQLAGVNHLPTVWKDRLTAYVFLHDLGKANRGFRRRWQSGAPTVGHILPAVYLCSHDGWTRFGNTLQSALPIDAMAGWGGDPGAFLAILAHHGRPVSATVDGLHELWKPGQDGNPVLDLAELGAAVRRWIPEAFLPGGPALPTSQRFWHAVAGLTMLADWVGSDAKTFPLANGTCPDRMAWARSKAPIVLRGLGFDPAEHRATRTSAPSFKDVSKWPGRPAQLAVGSAVGRAIIFESETGSGKTEAALWRFAQLFTTGKVDGLYFALPTRVAATAMFDRIKTAIGRLFPDASRPAVLLAVPGYAKIDEATAAILPDFKVQWDDHPDEAKQLSRWAAERPKRFLAGTIAVGTIDQALLGAIQVKHAHLRAACMLRHLLVVDEVHASDAYMEQLLANLLSFHTGAGGHALLLSATLGSAARARLLQGTRAQPPPLAEAEALPYPSISTDELPVPALQESAGRIKKVKLAIDTAIAEPGAIAARSLDAARRGAKVLVVRNTHRDAVATAEALLALAPDDPVLFRCENVPTLHHGRFAREDRALLDAAVNEALGRERASGGLVLIGTQTLEQSLDIDADLIITDICPTDVLLQRMGRLHRHPRNDRPVDFAEARAIILCPADLSAHLKRGGAKHGLGGKHGPYADLLAVEATRRLIAEHPIWTIPDMNRMLVERTTHPEALERLSEALETERPGWLKAFSQAEGRQLSNRQEALNARMKWDVSFLDDEIMFPSDGEKVATRLGARDLTVTFESEPLGPFGRKIRMLSIPNHWLHGIDLSLDTTPTKIVENGPTLGLGEGSSARAEIDPLLRRAPVAPAGLLRPRGDRPRPLTLCTR